MPPKKKANKRGEKVKKSIIPEVDCTYYENQIKDLNLILSTLRSKNFQLTDKHAELLEVKERMQQDEIDIVQFVKRNIQMRENQIQELQEECNKIEEERTSAMEAFEDKKQVLMNCYRELEEQMVADMKLFVGKERALEEFRIHRIELMDKYVLLENALEEQQVRHKQEIYEVERNYVIGKDKLKKEVNAQLEWLIEEFTSVAYLRVFNTSQGVIRENLLLRNYLEGLLLILRQLFREHEEMRVNDAVLKTMSEVWFHEATVVSKTARHLMTELVTLVNEYFAMNSTIKTSQCLGLATRVEAIKKEQLESEAVNQQCVQMKRMLNQNLHQSRCEREEISAEFRHVNERNQSLTDMLRQAEKMIESHKSDDVMDDFDSPESGHLHRESRSTMLFKLYGFLKEVKEWHWHDRPSARKQLEDDELIYKQGKLGLVPIEVDSASVLNIKDDAVQADLWYPEKYEIDWLEVEGSVEVEIAGESEEVSSCQPKFSRISQETQTDEDDTSSSTLSGSDSTNVSEEDSNET